jgi:RNA polymerase sigma factor (sigma-70 family)
MSASLRFPVTNREPTTLTGVEPTEREQFEALVKRCQAAVCAVAYAKLRDRARSEEIAQEAFLVAWLRRGEADLGIGWVCGIARNLARNANRRHKELAMTTEVGGRDLREEMIERETERDAAAALARLPERYREAVVLYYRGDESLAAVAIALGITEAAARQRVHRGREKLREALTPVERTLRGTRPGAAFTAAVLAAWFARGRDAAAATITGKGGTALLATAATTSFTPALLAAIGIGAVLVIGTITVVATHALSSSSKPASSPRVAARFPAMAGIAPSAGHFIVAARAPALPAAAVTTNPTIDADFKQAPMLDMVEVVSVTLDVPIWVDPAVGPSFSDVSGHALDPIDVLDHVITDAHAQRTEVEAVRLVSFGGEPNASVLGGDPVTIDLHGAPLNDVLRMLEVPLHLPIGRIALPDSDALDTQPTITLSVNGVTAGAAFEQVLAQAHLGYELTTGFAITKR